MRGSFEGGEVVGGELLTELTEVENIMALGPVAQIHISVTDLDRSVAFYRDVLGMSLQFVVPGQPMAFFASGDVRLYLGVPESPEFRTHTVIYYSVGDIDAEYARLTALGVEFEGEPHVVHREPSGELWMTFLEDPDGHKVVLMQQRVAGSGAVRSD